MTCVTILISVCRLSHSLNLWNFNLASMELNVLWGSKVRPKASPLKSSLTRRPLQYIVKHIEILLYSVSAECFLLFRKTSHRDILILTNLSTLAEKLIGKLESPFQLFSSLTRSYNTFQQSRLFGFTPFHYRLNSSTGSNSFDTESFAVSMAKHLDTTLRCIWLLLVIGCISAKK